MANEQTTLVRIAVQGAIAVGPFRAGKAYAVPSDVVALLGDRFAATTLAKDEKPADCNAEHQALFEALRAKKGANDAAPVAAKADAGVTDKTTPAAAGTVTGG